MGDSPVLLVSLDQRLGIGGLEQRAGGQRFQQADGIRPAQQFGVFAAPAQNEVLDHKFNINDTSRVLLEVKAAAPAGAQFGAHALTHVAHLVAQGGGLAARGQPVELGGPADRAGRGDPPEEPEAPGRPVAVGARVRWTSLGITGEVLALHGDDEAELAVSGKRVRVPREELVAVAGARPSGGGTSVAVAEVPSRGEVPAEINLIGLTVDEARGVLGAIPAIDERNLAQRPAV